MTIGEEGTTVAEVAGATGVGQSTVRRALGELEFAGRASRQSGHNTVPDTWRSKAKTLPRSEYSVCASGDGKGWEVLCRAAGETGFEQIVEYEIEAAAVEVAHMLNGWAGREL